ncbi:MAG: ABC transporter ATP-binding protein [Pseudomonadota bacterium]|nr:ABC transporter ATP-binding protein [Pseudomonadota bacterium]
MSIHAAPFRELRLDGLGRDFGSLNALRDITLTIKQGEFIALLGPSGCGKSTTLNCIAGLLSATAGAIWLDDRRIDTLRPEQRGFGMVFQNYALFPHMTVRKNIAFGLMMRDIKRAEIDRRVAEAVALVRLQGQEHKLPGQLSGGQQQRVAIARAIVVEPPLVLMDEPLSNLDAKLRLEMRAEIRRIHSSLNATTIYVTHDQEEALSLADRIVVLKDGTIRQVGTPAELFAQPRDRDVAEFMGFRNAIAGVVAQINGAEVVLQASTGVVRGQAQGSLSVGQPAMLVVRPEDLIAEDGGALTATVVSSEFRGHGHTGFARMVDGTELVFSAAGSAPPGSEVHLAAHADRALVYAT